ncbi:MAG: phosphatidylserine decarboxylase [uncultured archaeon A07HR60]|nr:MAG: phosphatidylserine decarboxylase [uncultured archaeon A07HR60]
MTGESLLASVAEVTPAIAPGAGKLSAIPAVIAVPTLLVSPPLAIGLVGLAVCVLWFHRDPDRVPPEPGAGFLAPADGKISVIREEENEDKSTTGNEAGDGRRAGASDSDGPARLRIGVFMNVTDVHVNRAPASGTVESLDHRPGANRPAFSKDSDRNERLRINHGRYTTVMIAGWFARRIYPYVGAGDTVEAGDRIGHVSFGSRADVVLPPDVSREDLQVSVGDRVRAGETVLADGATPADKADSEALEPQHVD